MILDTNALSAIVAKNAALDRVLGRSELAIPVIVLGEYRYGLLQSRERTAIGAWLELFVTHCTVLPVQESTVPYYAAVRLALRNKGRPIPSNDVWIAALAREHRLPIVSRDTHFDEVEGVRRIAW